MRTRRCEVASGPDVAPSHRIMDVMTAVVAFASGCVTAIGAAWASVRVAMIHAAERREDREQMERFARDLLAEHEPCDVAGLLQAFGQAKAA